MALPARGMGSYAAAVGVFIRPAREKDLERINEIYNTTIVESHVSFDLEPWDLERRLRWWERYGPDGPFRACVTEVGGSVVGVAYSSPYRPKEAYQRSVETTIVLDPEHVGVGIGRRLLTTLLGTLRDDGIHRAYAIIALPNDASIGLHQSVGYRVVGTLDQAGYKLGKYWSTTILELRLDEVRE
jgi:phosphinothricin acetyltransferase